MEKAEDLFSPKDLKGERILITAGPTQEPIDPVRFITNLSSGKMGYALAKMARRRGAEVILITGPTSSSLPRKDIEWIPVKSEARKRFDHLKPCSVVIKAAVAIISQGIRSRRKGCLPFGHGKNGGHPAEIGSKKEEI
jgi:phosphopantothenoylcysteine decarboxylase/phosphopantothenate--cysteine ligase